LRDKIACVFYNKDVGVTDFCYMEREGVEELLDSEETLKVLVDCDNDCLQAYTTNKEKDINTLYETTGDIGLHLDYYSYTDREEGLNEKFDEFWYTPIETVFGTKLLIPVITVNEKGQLLMQAYMNRECFNGTIIEEKACYFSRNRGVWEKGSSSGNIQEFKNIWTNYDASVLLMQVKQNGTGACCTGNYSCFYKKLKGGDEL